VNGAWAEIVDRLDMGGVVVAEVGFEPVAGKLDSGFDHEAVAGDFGEDGSGGDGGVF
jgi:hypothetical protein